MPELNRLTAHLDPPFAVLDLDAFDRNADSLVRRAGGTPIRVASKSVRVRWLLSRVLGRPGFAGVMAFSLAEALWLIETGTVPVEQDVLVAYPSLDRGAFTALAADPEARRRIVVMADDRAHLDLAEAAMRAPGRLGEEPLRVCIDVDASYRIGRIHLGARRSPLRTPADVAPLLQRLVASPELSAAGLMFYDAQIAGVADTSPVVRAMQHRSARELVTRRACVVAAARDIAGEGLLVNAGGTGSLHILAGDASVTELAAGSGLLAPHLFDSYRGFTPEPAAFFVAPVVRRPSARIVTVLGGGLVASGAAGRSRLPLPWWPEGMHFIGTEGAGEVQTPLVTAPGDALNVGDRVWFRHAKAGELCERFDVLHLVSGGELVTTTPTYRGEGRCFG
ncbi:amino acid deaminase/aldolase [Gephyromycinifex aptenodytis]|uniref:amino acid deaminase/aldolase n=1 Tax=Gephyromycinifex aptenodytis TaxID=2716227 RepID=UPI0014472FF7|nr:amino acid deaminase/aldolase [Gephyromycinifex aptenodytis]